MENSNLSVSPSSIVNILTLRYDPSIVPALPKKTWEDFQPVHDEVDLEFIENSLLQKVSEKLDINLKNTLNKILNDYRFQEVNK